MGKRQNTQVNKQMTSASHEFESQFPTASVHEGTKKNRCHITKDQAAEIFALKNKKDDNRCKITSSVLATKYGVRNF